MQSKRSLSAPYSQIMKSFVSGFLLSLLLASANCNSLKVPVLDRDSCEAACAAQGGGPVCDVNGRQFPNRCDAEQCAKVSHDKSLPRY